MLTKADFSLVIAYKFSPKLGNFQTIEDLKYIPNLPSYYPESIREEFFKFPGITLEITRTQKPVPKESLPYRSEPKDLLEWGLIYASDDHKFILSIWKWIQISPCDNTTSTNILEELLQRGDAMIKAGM